MGHNPRRFAAQKRTTEPALAMRAHDDKIAAFVLSRFDDGAIRIAVAPMQSPHLYACTTRIRHDVLQDARGDGLALGVVVILQESQHRV